MKTLLKITAGGVLATVLLASDGLQLTGSLQALAQNTGSLKGGRVDADSLDGTPSSSPDFHRLNEIPGLLLGAAYHALVDAFSSDGAPADAAQHGNGDSYGGENTGGPAGPDGPMSGNA